MQLILQNEREQKKSFAPKRNILSVFFSKTLWRGRNVDSITCRSSWGKFTFNILSVCIFYFIKSILIRKSRIKIKNIYATHSALQCWAERSRLQALRLCKGWQSNRTVPARCRLALYRHATHPVTISYRTS